MKYETTIAVEIQDEEIDVVELVRNLARRFPEILSLGVVGRTDEGEVIREMHMGRGGEVDWTDEAKVRIAEATQEITSRLGVDEETASHLWEGMSDVYEMMAARNLCAYPGGPQSVRLIPEALEFIRDRARQEPD
jgi:hypothetical protein